MSIEDETELKDLLLQTLAENGCLAKIKAKLRASVFLALEEDMNLSGQKPLLNEKVDTSLKTSEGRLIFCIVKEFLEYFNLKSTMAVFDAESYLGSSYEYKGRSKISTDLGLTSENENVPLLQRLVQLAQEKPRRLEVNLNINRDTSEVIDNDTISSSNSIKTETSLSEQYSEDVSKDVSTDKRSTHNNRQSDLISEYNNENSHNENINKTFITETNYTLNNSEDFINSNNDLTNGSSGYNISEVHSTGITSPSVLSLDKNEETTPPVLKDMKISPEKVKSPPKSDKFKAKNNLNSLSDLPPLNMNKSLSGKILPSLYNKEFREKPNL